MLQITREVTRYSARGLELDVEGRWAFLVLPPDTPAEQTAGWVWYAPTLRPAPPQTKGYPNARQDEIVAHLLAREYAFAGIDVGESHGNPAGRALYTAFHRGLVETFGLAGKAVLLPQSRGGLMLYNWAVEHPDRIARVAGIYTVCNLHSYPRLERAAPAYGLKPEELAARGAEHNPLDRLAPLAAAEVPIFHIHGDADTVVPLEDNAGELVKRYRALGGAAELLIIPGKGHEEVDEFFTNQRFMDFLTDG